MMSRMFDVFPTSLMQFKVDNITSQDVQDAVSDIDYVIEQDKYLQRDDVTPMWQSLAVLFRDDVPWFKDKKSEVWNKLLQSFQQACQEYLNTVDGYSRYSGKIHFTNATAWFYKKSTDVLTDTNPVHDHNPALLTGVFYLKNPGDPNANGTEFYDYRTMGNVNQTMMGPGDEGTWVIFPGWLQHRSSAELNNCQPRYVIAANAYAASY